MQQRKSLRSPIKFTLPGATATVLVTSVTSSPGRSSFNGDDEKYFSNKVSTVLIFVSIFISDK